MEKSIREYVKENFKNNSTEEIKSSIESGINESEEVILPGLGVFFEIVWQNSNQDQKSMMLELLHKNL